MNSSGWHYHENGSEIKDLSWDRLYTDAGLVIRKDFTWKDGFERLINKHDSSIRYLEDAFLHLRGSRV